MHIADKRKLRLKSQGIQCDNLAKIGNSPFKIQEEFTDYPISALF